MARPRSEAELIALKARGIGALLSLTEQPLSSELLSRLGLQAEHIPVADFTAPTIEQIEQAVAAIDRFLASELPIAVHCGAGLGRTGTILACYLVSQGASAKTAMNIVRAKRPGSLEVVEQEKAVVLYERHLFR